MEIGILISIISPIIGYIFVQIRRINVKLDDTVTEVHLRQVVEDKLESLRTRDTDLKERLDRVENKIDKLLEHRDK
jgi:hypothetical protein